MNATTTITRTRQLPWVGIGTSGEWDRPIDALVAGAIDFSVEQVPAYDNHGTIVPGIKVNRNLLTGEIVGVTSDQYGVIQNDDAFGMLDPFCKAGGVIEHVGMTGQGMCFMVMRMPAMAFGFCDDDFDLYVCAMNSFNTRFPLAIIITPVRVYCQNMFRKLMRRNDAVLVIKHGRLALDRMLSASKASDILLDYKKEFVDTLDRDCSLDRNPDDVHRFIERMLPFTPETPEHPRARQTNERVKEQREEFYYSYYLAPDNTRYFGTRLGVLNAYYDWVTHHVPYRTPDTFEDNRLGGLLSGTTINNKLILSA